MDESLYKIQFSVDEHLAIVDALEQGDVVNVRELMEQHLSHLEGTLHLEVERDDKPDFAEIFSAFSDR